MLQASRRKIFSIIRQSQKIIKTIKLKLNLCQIYLVQCKTTLHYKEIIQVNKHLQVSYFHLNLLLRQYLSQCSLNNNNNNNNDSNSCRDLCNSFLFPHIPSTKKKCKICLPLTFQPKQVTRHHNNTHRIAYPPHRRLFGRLTMLT